MHISKKPKYRTELDGLRAFAVLMVIINHFNKDILPSGYLGVDIFFVISGYVITSSLSKRQSHNFSNFILSFYERRIKRLLPALVFFVLIFSILICFFNIAPTLSLRTGITSLFGFSNLYLLKQSTDYFGQSTQLNVFTHTWSLGVEEQFYFLFPFLIWFTGYGRHSSGSRKNLFLTLSFLISCSFILYIFLNQTNQSAAYFLMPTRFWEMGLGCLLFLGLGKKGFILKNLTKIPSLILFLLISSAMFLPETANVSATTLVVIFTLSLICSLEEDTFLFNLLTFNKVVYIGRISYSLYLWHWGILAISRWTIGVQSWSIPIQIALIYFLSVFSYEFIEKPLRMKEWSLKSLTTILKGIFTVLISIFTLIILDKSLHKRLFLGKNSSESLNSQKKRDFQCSFRAAQKLNTEEIFEKCFFKNPTHKMSLFFLGDSHTYRFREGAKYIAQNTSSNMFIFSAAGTAFPSVKYIRVDTKRQLLLSHELFKSLEEKVTSNAKEGDIIFITMRMPYHFIDGIYENSADRFRYFDKNGKLIYRDSKKQYFEEWSAKIQQLSSNLILKNVKVVIMGPSPEFPYAVNQQCKEQNIQWFNVLSKKNCSYSLASLSGKSGKYFQLISDLRNITDKYHNLFFFNPLNALCPDSICNFSHNGEALYDDDDHISKFASQKILGPELLKFLKEKKILTKLSVTK
tara:strand:+ start:214 stop:2277 length:2064 start_codon:yes stop_codon:yes gene_type:complete